MASSSVRADRTRSPRGTIPSHPSHPSHPDGSTVPARRRWRLLGVLLVVTSASSATGIVVLSSVFGWPAILDEPASVALPAFLADETAVSVAFYLLLLGSLLLLPVAIGLEAALTRGTPAARVTTAFGIAGALFQVLGWVRWPLVVPALADRYADPATDAATRAATAAAYDLVNSYAGGAVGEHLGWLFQAPWAIAVGVLALGAAGVPRWVGWVGVASAVVWTPLIVLEPFVEPFSSGAVSGLAFTAYSVWFVWLAVLGAVVGLRRVGAPEQRPA